MKVGLRGAGRTDSGQLHSTSVLEASKAFSCCLETQHNHLWIGPGLRKPREKQDPDLRTPFASVTLGIRVGHTYAALSTSTQQCPGRGKALRGRSSEQRQGSGDIRGPEQDKLRETGLALAESNLGASIKAGRLFKVRMWKEVNPLHWKLEHRDCDSPSPVLKS